VTCSASGFFAASAVKRAVLVIVMLAAANTNKLTNIHFFMISLLEVPLLFVARTAQHLTRRCAPEFACYNYDHAVGKDEFHPF
jgi:hypothetical protein